jgi:hypothetical protein
MTARARTHGPSMPATLLLPVAIFVAGGLLALRLHFQPPTVPPYSLVDPAVGAGAGDEVQVVRGGLFAVEVRPEEPVVGAVGARAFLVRGTEVRPWDPPFEVKRDGSVTIAGPVNALFAGVPEGPWQMALAVGRPETLPTAPNDILRGESDAGAAAWRLVRRRIRLGP